MVIKIHVLGLVDVVHTLPGTGSTTLAIPKLGSQKPGCFHNSPITFKNQHKKNFKFKNSSITPSYQHVLAQRHPRSNMKYLTGYVQSPAVLTSTVDVSTARLWIYPVKYFTVKKFASLAIISQNPGFIEIQVLEMFYNVL